MRRWILALAVGAFAVTPCWAAGTDQEVAQQIADSMRASGRLKGYSIAVKYKEGTARLEGTVRSQEQLDQALEIANRAPEVRRVINNLSINPNPPGQPAGALPQLAAGLEQPRGNTVAPGPVPVQPMAASALMPSPASQPTPAAGAAQSLREAVYSRGQNGTEASQANFASQQGQPPRPLPLAVAQQPQMMQPQAIQPQQMQPQQMQPQQMPQQQMAVEPAMQAQQPGRGIRSLLTQAVGRQPAQPQQAMPQQSMPQQAMPQQQLPYYAPANGRPMQAMYGQPMPATPVAYQQPGAGGPMPAYVNQTGAGVAPAVYDQPHLPNYAWPSYAPYPNYAALTYPKQYSPSAWPYIGPFYPYPQVPLGWRKVTMEWDDGWWFLNFADDRRHCNHGHSY